MGTLMNSARHHSATVGTMVPGYVKADARTSQLLCVSLALLGSRNVDWLETTQETNSVRAFSVSLYS